MKRILIAYYQSTLNYRKKMIENELHGPSELHNLIIKFKILECGGGCGWIWLTEKNPKFLILFCAILKISIIF